MEELPLCIPPCLLLPGMQMQWVELEQSPWVVTEKPGLAHPGASFKREKKLINKLLFKLLLLGG